MYGLSVSFIAVSTILAGESKATGHCARVLEVAVNRHDYACISKVSRQICSLSQLLIN